MKYYPDKDMEILELTMPKFESKLEFARWMINHTWSDNNVFIGRNTIIDSSAIIGEAGFGYVKGEDGKWLHIPHIGRVVIGDNVHIGSQCVIHCGTIDDTVIGDGTKIDTFTHIAHNCKVGKNCIICSHVVLCGSVTIEDDVWIGPGALIKQKLTIGKGAVIGMGAVVLNDVPAGATVYGNPARSKEEWEMQKAQ